MADTQQLLLQAAGAAVQEHQAGKLAPSVEDILHLEKRWDKLPGASAGSVALEDAAALLGAEVLAGDALEFVAAQVFSGEPPAVLSKRQFLAFAHVAEVAQSKAFDLVTAEDALRTQAPPLSHKKRPPTIRDAHIDTWQIAAGLGLAAAEHSATPQYEAVAALAMAAPGPLESHLSRAGSLQLPAGSLELGVQDLSRQNSVDGLSATLAMQQHAVPQHQQLFQSGATSYQSAEEMTEVAAAEEEAAGSIEGEEEAAEEAVGKFNTRLHGLMRKISSDAAPEHGKALLHMPEPLLVADDSAATAGAASACDEAPRSGKTRSSWESFNSTPGSASAKTAAAEQQAPATALAVMPPHPQQPQQVNEAMMAAAMAAGMTFMQHLQAAGAAGGAHPSPFADINPLRAVAAAAAAAAASPAVARGATPGQPASVPSSPDVFPAGAQLPQQVIAEMMAHLNLGDASSEQLQAVAATLQQQAMSMQHHPQQQQQAAAPHLGSMSSSAASGESLRRSWKAFEGEQALHQDAGRLARRQRAAAAVTVDHLQPPRPASIAGWEPMSGNDVHRCCSIFAKKGYPQVGGMEKHCAMEYFAKLHMQPHIFHTAWQAADVGADGRLDCREFCLFVQLLRGAQKGHAVPERLAPEEAAALLGEVPMPGGPAAAPLLHIDSAHLRSVLANSRQASLAGQDMAEAVLQGFDPEDEDDASSIDSGIAESVSGMSVSSRTLGAGAGHFGLTRPSAQLHTHTGLGSVLGGSAMPSYQPAVVPIAYGGPGGSQAMHSVLEVVVRSAEVRYRKTLSTPIFTISVRDTLGRLVELPIDTHPGHFRRETGVIHSSAIVKLATQLQHIPPGSVLFLEIKHWKTDKKRFSTLAWACTPLEKLVDFGPSAARVRSGPVDLPLFKKPLDVTLRRTKRLTSRAYDLHLTVRGIE